MTSDWSSSDLDLSRHDVPRPEYPRPDFQRGTVEGLDWINLNGLWDFEFDPDNIGLDQGWYKNDDRLTQSIVVPFAWESHLAWDEGHLASNDNWFSKHAFRQPEKVNHANYRDQERYEIGWYGTLVDIPTHWTSKQVILHFCASDWETRVWVNGRFAGTHEGGYDAFLFDVTAFCTSSETAHIVVRVYDPNDHRAQPGGKQINWYARTSGLWQTVYLEPRPLQYIRRVHITPDIDTGKAIFDVDADHTEQAQIHIVTTAPDGSEFQTDGVSNETPFELSIPDPICWSPETPHLYEVAVELIVDGKTVDRMRTYFGMRKVSVDVLPGTDTRYIFLNNKPIYLCGALNQSFNPWGIYTFPSDESIQKDLQRTLDFGFNFLRLHIKIEEPRFLYWADRMGVLLMCDIPNFDHPGYGAEAQERWEATMRAAIERDYNHPSIVSWCCFNETWGLGGDEYKQMPDRQEWVRKMYRLTRSLDATRLVEDNSPCLYDHVETQINSWHFYINDYTKAKEHIQHVVDQTYPGSSFNYTGENKQGDEPLMNSEYGGIGAGAGDKDISWCFKYLTNELRLHEKICGYIYTELQDIEWEHNGFMNYDRSVKAFGYDYRMINAPDVVLIDAPPGQVLSGGDHFQADVLTSHFSHQDIPSAVLRWRLDGVGSWGEDYTGLDEGHAQIPWVRYRVNKVQTLDVSLPAGHKMCTLHIWVEDHLGSVLARNFIHIEVYDGPLPGVDLQPHFLTIRYELLARNTAVWSEGVREDGDVIIGSGSGRFSYNIVLPDGFDTGRCQVLEIWAELSAGREETPQTELPGFPTDLSIWINDVLMGEVTLADAPSDCRGALSYIHGVSGRYGELVRVIIDDEDLVKVMQKVKDQFTLRFEVSSSSQNSNGLAIYGARAGRYPLQPFVIFRY